jgi:hypothetical protein
MVCWTRNSFKTFMNISDPKRDFKKQEKSFMEHFGRDPGARSDTHN